MVKADKGILLSLWYLAFICKIYYEKSIIRKKRSGEII